MHLSTELINPPNEFSVMPFWFWNDDLDEAEILRQIDDFVAHGVSGFTIHPRVGLPRSLGWMSEDLLHFYDVALAEAQRRGLKVLLYDEGMYPSGSSSGQVVATNPDFQCRCLAKVDHTGGVPYQLQPGENLVAILPDENGHDVSIIDRKVDAVIRGLHYLNEDLHESSGEPLEEETPPAGDLLNPAAVECFIDLVYRQFLDRFAPYVGNTILAIFTDEPDMLGRCQEPDVLPGTTGILEQVNALLGYDFTPHLAKLWSSDEADRAHYRHIYVAACESILEESYYARLSAFCQEAGIALTGHPAKGDDLGMLRYFDMPGQDLVWRWVLPDDPTALEGPESTQGKCSSSAMIHAGQRRNINELCGAYGHELTWDEMMWLANWCMVRGVNLLVPHAFYYSVRGPRLDERPPDVGPNAAWWPRYREYADTFRRLCWINTDGQHVCRVAILGQANRLPWRPAKVCFEHQFDFNYIEERALWEDAQVTATGVALAGMEYDVLVTEFDANERARPALQTLEAAGRLVCFETGAEGQLLERLHGLVAADVSITPRHPGLRVRHVVKEGLHYVLLFNETQEAATVTVSLAQAGSTWLFDAVTGEASNIDLSIPLHFDGHEMKVLLVSETSSEEKREGVG